MRGRGSRLCVCGDVAEGGCREEVAEDGRLSGALDGRDAHKEGDLEA